MQNNPHCISILSGAQKERQEYGRSLEILLRSAELTRAGFPSLFLRFLVFFVRICPLLARFLMMRPLPETLNRFLAPVTAPTSRLRAAHGVDQQLGLGHALKSPGLLRVVRADDGDVVEGTRHEGLLASQSKRDRSTER